MLRCNYSTDHKLGWLLEADLSPPALLQASRGALNHGTVAATVRHPRQDLHIGNSQSCIEMFETIQQAVVVHNEQLPESGACLVQPAIEHASMLHEPCPTNLKIQVTLCMARELGVDSVTLYLPSYGVAWFGVEQSLHRKGLRTSVFDARCSARYGSTAGWQRMGAVYLRFGAVSHFDVHEPQDPHTIGEYPPQYITDCHSIVHGTGFSPFQGCVLFLWRPQPAVIRQAVLRYGVLDAACSAFFLIFGASNCVNSWHLAVFSADAYSIVCSSACRALTYGPCRRI